MPALEINEKRYQRERERRRAAEHLLDEKSRELYQANQDLQATLAELKKNQKQLVDAEKMASLGIMSAGVAHEINNPIGFVTSNVATLTDYLEAFRAAYAATRNMLEAIPESSKAHDSKTTLEAHFDDNDIDYLFDDTTDVLTETSEGLARIKAIVAGLKSFSHSGEDKTDDVNMREVVESVLAIARNDLKGRVELTVALDDLPTFRGNHGQLSQVMLNLISNAGQAIGDAGHIAIAGTASATEVSVTVSDDGCGIAPEHLDQLFTPFFTTKEVGAGTGLGLSISQGIIHDHDGTITVTSEVGAGTAFTISLPIDP